MNDSVRASIWDPLTREFMNLGSSHIINIHTLQSEIIQFIYTPLVSYCSKSSMYGYHLKKRKAQEFCLKDLHAMIRQTGSSEFHAEPVGALLENKRPASPHVTKSVMYIMFTQLIQKKT